MNKLVLSIAAPISLAAPLLAQDVAPAIPVSINQGMLNGQPLGVASYDPQNSSYLFDRRIGIRPRGAGGTLLGPVIDVIEWDPAVFGNASGLHPDYRPEALFENWVPALFGGGPWNELNPLHYAELNGMSSGADVTPAVMTDGEDAGRLLMDQPGDADWYIISFTVENSADPLPNSIVEMAITEAQSSGNPLGHYVLSYCAEGSREIRPGIPDTARMEYLPTQLGLDSGRTISALDWSMGLISESPNGGTSSLVPVRNQFYFSVSADWVSEVTNFNSGTTPMLDGQPLDAATVYVMTWSGGIWNPPVIACPHLELLGEIVADADIDGLSVYMGDGSPEDPTRVVFSLDQVSGLELRNEPPNQILITQYDGGSTPNVTAVPLRTESGTLMTEKFGVEEGPTDSPDLENTCGVDPGDEEVVRDQYQGTPLPGTQFGPNGGLGHSSILFGDFATNTATLSMQASGIDLPGYDLIVLEYFVEYYDVQNSAPLDRANALGSTAFQGFDLTSNYEVPVALPMASNYPIGTYPTIELRTWVVAHGFNFLPMGGFDVDPNIAASWPCAIQVR